MKVPNVVQMLSTIAGGRQSFVMAERLRIATGTEYDISARRVAHDADKLVSACIKRIPPSGVRNVAGGSLSLASRQSCNVEKTFVAK